MEPHDGAHAKGSLLKKAATAIGCMVLVFLVLGIAVLIGVFDILS